MEWHIIKTGRVWVDAGGPFGLVPRSLWAKHQTPDEHNRVAMDLNCLLVRSAGKTILVDTGLGDKLSPKAAQQWGLEHPHGTLLENLAVHGVAPEDIDLVIDTHLHADHCGGNTRMQDGEVVPTFPQAEYWVQYIEWAGAMHPNARTRATYLPVNFEPLWARGRLRTLHGDTPVTSEVSCVVTPGHTRGHQSVILHGEGPPVMFVADLASYAVHMARTAWVTAYDVEPLETIATKKSWQTWALKHQAKLVFEHDTQIPLGQLIKDEDGRLSVVPAAAG
ncbi:MAG: MBL fold metallo-hydrolase [Anaerolineae bacterium]|nr:MBL fold metallo-hydrolase [Anaerolineae bacterium]